jgi:hypothetical protein
MKLWSWHWLSNWAWGLHSSRMLHGQAWQQFMDISGQLSRVPKHQSLANLWRGTYQNSEHLNYTSMEASISHGRARLRLNRNLTVFYEHHPDSLYSPVHFGIFILVINQLDAQNFCFTVSLFCSLYMFWAHVLIIRSKLHYTASGIITSSVQHQEVVWWYHMCSKHVQATK